MDRFTYKNYLKFLQNIGKNPEMLLTYSGQELTQPNMNAIPQNNNDAGINIYFTTPTSDLDDTMENGELSALVINTEDYISVKVINRIVLKDGMTVHREGLESHTVDFIKFIKTTQDEDGSSGQMSE